MSTNFYAVDEADERQYKGIFLGKRAGGWVFQIKWHDYKWCECGCEDETHLYRHFDELVDYLIDEDKVIKDEYGEIYAPYEFIEIVMNWTEENDREPGGANVWEIGGYHFVRGNWS